MCGIYGFIGKPDKNTEETIKSLGLLNAERGNQSAGLAIINGGKVQIYKKAVTPSQFFTDMDKAKHIGIYKNSSMLTILGHTRLATHGSISDENAHPFKDKSIVFTHNGIISNFEELQHEYSTKYNVDSQIIGHLLNEKDQLKAFKKLSGFFTIPYVNLQERDMLQVAVHSQAFSYASKGGQLYYSSDVKHLRSVLKGQGFQICDGGNDLLYRFYKVGEGIAVSKERIEAKRSYVYSYSSYAWDYENYYRSLPQCNVTYKSKKEQRKAILDSIDY